MKIENIHVETPADFSFAATIHAHGWKQLEPFRYSEVNGTLEVPVNLVKAACLISLKPTSGNRINLEIRSERPLSGTIINELKSLVGNLLGLGQDITDLNSLINKHPEYSWVSHYKLGRLLASPTVWEDLVKTIATTNITWTQTIDICKNLTKLGHLVLGRYCFPTPAQVALADPIEFAKITRLGYRAKHVHELATAIASGVLDVEIWRNSSLSTGELYSKILELSGFGPYATGNVLRLLGRHEKLAIDSVVRNSLAEKLYKGIKPTDFQIESRYKKFGAWADLIMWFDAEQTTLLSSLERNGSES